MRASSAARGPAGISRLRDQGFTLIEIAVVLVIVGLLAGGGVSLMRVLTERKARNEALAHLKDSRQALIGYAERTGRLPWADSDGDGAENSGASSGTFPFLTLQAEPRDAYRRTLRYALNANLGTGRAACCSALRAGLAGAPLVVDADGAGAAFPVAAVIVSAGPMDADTDGNVFDRLAAGTHPGDNTDGQPNYLRHPPVTGFDDLVIYLGANELYAGLCEYAALAVNNHSAATIYVHDSGAGADLGSVAPGGSNSYNVLSSSRVELRSAAGGGGAIVPSTPPTPLALAGRGLTVTLP
jgi:prepilin-type N-terminal cleavage/methylation domain-containing protein